MRLRGRLHGDENRELRRALAVWLQRVVLPGLVPGEVMPLVNDLQEVTAMVAERGLTWPERWKQEGLQEGMQQGIQQGIQQGMQQGMQEGEARVLLRQLALRFGELPEDVRSRVADADADTLLRWSEQVLTADTIEDVLA